MARNLYIIIVRARCRTKGDSYASMWMLRLHSVTGNLLELELRMEWRRPFPTFFICFVTLSYLSNRAYSAVDGTYGPWPWVNANAWEDLPRKPLPEKWKERVLNIYMAWTTTTQYKPYSERKVDSTLCKIPKFAATWSCKQRFSVSRGKDSCSSKCRGGSEGQLVSYGKNLAKLL